jgi:hypothetical protein
MRLPAFYKINRKIKKIIRNFILGPVLKQTYGLYYNNLAPDNKIIWINPWMDIDGFYRFKKEFVFEGQIKGGDWNRKTFIVSEKNCKSKEEFKKRIFQVPKTGKKFKGLIERFREEKLWRNTALFSEWYLRDLDKTLKTRRCRNLAELERHYETRYDRLFENIKEQGVLPFCSVSGISPLYLCIGPEGQIFHYSGSHRLFMAMILGIEKIPYKVLIRHKDWQKKRELILGNPANLNDDNLLEFLDHPDLIDELATVFPVSSTAL